jgi:hypothetical protein
MATVAMARMLKMENCILNMFVGLKLQDYT